MPKLSIIIPYYNNGKTIQITLNSLLEQSFQDFEIIIVDDGSNDDVHEKLKPYESRIRYLYKENGGPASAQNFGWREAKGEYISFCDADDYYLDKDFFANAIAIFQSQAEIQAVYSGWLIVDEVGKTLAESKPWEHIPDFMLVDWLKWSPSRYHALILRNKVLEDFGGIKAKYRLSDDAYFIMNLVLAGIRFAWYPHLAVAYVRHPASATSRKPLEQAENNLAMWRELLSHPSIPDSIDTRPIYYHKIMWTISVLYKAGLDIRPLIQESSAYSDHSVQSLAFDQMSQILKQSWQDAYAYRESSGLVPIFQANIRAHYPYQISGAELLTWWLDVWSWFYLNYEYDASDIADKGDKWQSAIKNYANPLEYAALSLALMPSAGYGSGKSMTKLLDDFAQVSNIKTDERQFLEAVWQIRLLRSEKFGIFRQRQNVQAWLKAIALYLQLKLLPQKRPNET